jgi:hypothetical protein
MMQPAWLRIPIAVAAACVGVLHVLGAAQVGNEPYRGYRADPAHVVVEVNRNGPAERAGLAIGDRITRIGGVDVRGGQGLDARLRPKIGETQAISVQRDGRAVEVQLRFSGLPAIDAFAYLVSAFTGLSFLALGLWAYFRIPRTSTMLLALVGIGVGSVFVEMPYVDSASARALLECGLIVTTVAGFAALLHFMLVFPKAKRILARRGILLVLYVPAALVSAGCLLALALGPRGAGGEAALMNTLALLLVLVYFCLAVVAYGHGYMSAARQERSAAGLDFLALSLLLGLAPMVATAVAIVAPGVVLPGAHHYDVVWVLIPFALARATIRQAATAPMEVVC